MGSEMCIRDRPHVYLRSSTSCSLVSTQVFRRALTQSVDRGAEMCPLSGVTSYDKVWTKGAGNRGFECGCSYVTDVYT